MDNPDGGLDKLLTIEKGITGMIKLHRLVNELKEMEVQHQRFIKDLQDELEKTNQRLQQEGLERREVEERLRQKEEIRQTIFEWTEAAVAVLNEGDMIIVQANKKLEKILGIQREEMENKKSLLEFIADVDLERIKNQFLAVRSGSDGLSGGREYRFVDQQGTWKDLSVSMALIQDTGRIMASFLDVTERNHRRRRLSSGRRQKNIIKN